MKTPRHQTPSARALRSPRTCTRWLRAFAWGLWLCALPTYTACGSRSAEPQSTDTGNPGLIDEQRIRVESGATGFVVVGEAGSVPGGAQVTVRNQTTGSEGSAIARANGAFSVAIAGSLTDDYVLEVTAPDGRTERHEVKPAAEAPDASGTDASISPDDSSPDDSSPDDSSSDDSSADPLDAGTPVEGDAAAGACRAALPLRCGDRQRHSTLREGQPNAWGGYACSARAESGRETIYELSSDSACQARVQLSGLDSDLDLFLLRECDPISCTMAASTPLDIQTNETLTFTLDAEQDTLIAVDGYVEAAGAYDLSVDCLCGEGSGTFGDGEWALRVDRRWNQQLSSEQDPSGPLPEQDYVATDDEQSYVVRVSDDWQRVSVGDTPWLGQLGASVSGQLSYELDSGTFAGGRFVIWSSASGLQAELTIYGSGLPIVSSERGALVTNP